MFQGNR